MSRRSRVLGADPALRRSGLVLLLDGVDGPDLKKYAVVVSAGSARSERLFSIYSQFRRLLIAWQPQVAYFERPGLWRRPDGTRAEVIEGLEAARGVMLAACAEFAIPAHEVLVQELRRKVVGQRKVRSSDVLAYVGELGLDLPRLPRGGIDGDLANAVAVAMYGLGQELQSLEPDHE